MFQVSIRVISSIAMSIYNLFWYREVTITLLNKLTNNTQIKQNKKVLHQCYVIFILSLT